MSIVHAEHSRSKLALVAVALPLTALLCNSPLSQEQDIESLAPTEAIAPSPTAVETLPATPVSQPTTGASPTVPPPDQTGAASLTQDGITLFYDPSLILDITADTIPAAPEPGPFQEAHPDYVAFSFILDSGAVSVVRVQDYAALSDSAEEEMQRLKEMIAARPSQVQECVPQPALSAFYTICSHQQFDANIAYVDFQNGSGVRFVTVYAIQDAVPVSNEHLTYVFQGFTEDERYYVAAGFHITHMDLEEFVAEIPQEVYADTSGEALRQYFEEYEALLNAAEGRYQPLLSRFDEILSSLLIADQRHASLRNCIRDNTITVSKKLHLAVITLTLLLANCSQPEASPTLSPTDTLTPTPTATPAPTQTPTSTSTPTPTFAAPDDSVQGDMFRLIPPGFLSAGYCDVKRVREDPELKSIFEAVSGGCSLSGVPDDVDTLMGVSVLPSAAGSSGIALPIATIRRGNFDREAMAEQLQEDFGGALIQDYQGVELAVIETEQGLRLASAFIDDVTWVLGSEAVVKAVLDTAQDPTTPPLADMGATLPRVFWAAVWASCDYEAEGCTASVFVGLAKGPEGTISTIQLYQFENAEMAADALPATRTRQEEGISQFGSAKIVGDTITQEGRFVRVEGVLPIEDLSLMFE